MFLFIFSVIICAVNKGDGNIVKVNINKKNIKKLILALSTGAIITYGSITTGAHIDKNTHLPDFYYINIDNSKLSNEEFLKEFNDIINSRSDLKENWSEIREELNEFIYNHAGEINQERILKMIRNLKIKYNDNDFSDTVATTTFYNDTITYNGRFKLKKSDEQKEIKLHEAFHTLFGKGFYGATFNFTEIGKSLDEGTAQLLTEESNAYANATLYSKPTVYVKAICELIGTDKYLEALDSNDVWKLIDYLNEYGDLFDSIKLLKLIDKSYIYYSSTTDADEEAWKIIDKMYEKKNGVSIGQSNDEVMKIYSNKYGRTSYKITSSDFVAGNTVEKNYFINIEEQPKIHLSNSAGTLYLDENNSVYDQDNEFGNSLSK